MSLMKAIFSGFVGACAVTLINESARQVIKDAPRLDILGKRSIALPLMKTGRTPPKNDNLYWLSMAGDLAANTFYYSLLCLDDKENALRNGVLLGLTAGAGAVILPKPLGLGTESSARNTKTGIMTVAWYLAGGLAAAATYKALSEDE
jgi:hypothetical protein